MTPCTTLNGLVWPTQVAALEMDRLRQADKEREEAERAGKAVKPLPMNAVMQVGSCAVL